MPKDEMALYFAMGLTFICVGATIYRQYQKDGDEDAAKDKLTGPLLVVAAVILFVLSLASEKVFSHIKVPPGTRMHVIIDHPVRGKSDQCKPGPGEDAGSHITFDLPIYRYAYLSTGGSYLHESCAYGDDTNSIDRVGLYASMEYWRLEGVAAWREEWYYYIHAELYRLDRFALKATYIFEPQETFGLTLGWDF